MADSMRSSSRAACRRGTSPRRGALTFEPDTDEDDLLPGDRVARAEAAVAEAAEAAEASPEEIEAELAREAAEKAETENPA